jgi:hypothetical protein
MIRDDGVAALRAEGLGKRYGHVWGPRDCTFVVLRGRSWGWSVCTLQLIERW